jgi:hypothetical protein
MGLLKNKLLLTRVSFDELNKDLVSYQAFHGYILGSCTLIIPTVSLDNDKNII